MPTLIFMILMNHSSIPSPPFLQVRPGTEKDDYDESLQTYTCSDIKSSSPSSPPVTTPPVMVDPDASLITDFQIITDIRVFVCVCVCVCVCVNVCEHVSPHRVSSLLVHRSS